MTKIILIIVGVILVAGIAILALRFWGGDEDTWLCQNGEWVRHGNPRAEKPIAPCGEVEPTLRDDMRVDYPKPNAIVASPLEIKGEAKGAWYFEATFPVKLLDSAGNVIAQGTAQAEGDWMTDDFVPFQAHLEFQTPASQTGTLVLENDNPSGLPENSIQVKIPVRF